MATFSPDTIKASLYAKMGSLFPIPGIPKKFEEIYKWILYNGDSGDANSPSTPMNIINIVGMRISHPRSINLNKYKIDVANG